MRNEELRQLDGGHGNSGSGEARGQLHGPHQGVGAPLLRSLGQLQHAVPESLLRRLLHRRRHMISNCVILLPGPKEFRASNLGKAYYSGYTFTVCVVCANLNRKNTRRRRRLLQSILGTAIFYVKNYIIIYLFYMATPTENYHLRFFFFWRGI